MNEIEIVGIRLVGGGKHEHISELRWIQPGHSNSGAVFSRTELIDWLKSRRQRKECRRAFVTDGADVVYVRVINARHPYLQAYRDGIPTNTLLSLRQDW